MLHRVIATVLWGYFGWYLAGYLMALVGVQANLAILGGVAMAALAWIDVRGGRRGAAARSATTAPTAPAER